MIFPTSAGHLGARNATHLAVLVARKRRKRARRIRSIIVNVVQVIPPLNGLRGKILALGQVEDQIDRPIGYSQVDLGELWQDAIVRPWDVLVGIVVLKYGAGHVCEMCFSDEVVGGTVGRRGLGSCRQLATRMSQLESFIYMQGARHCALCKHGTPTTQTSYGPGHRRIQELRNCHAPCAKDRARHDDIDRS